MDEEGLPKYVKRMMERLAMFAVWVNYMKSFSEKKRDASPAERLGFRRGKLTVEQLLRRRLFASRVKLPDPWGAYYSGKLVTKAVPNGVEHTLTYAFLTHSRISIRIGTQVGGARDSRLS